MARSILIQQVHWHAYESILREIRTRVFVQEQGVPETLEWDGMDPHCRHWLAWYKYQAVATARLTPDGQIGRMAILPDWRKQGIGTDLLRTILSTCRHEGIKVFLNAQLDARDFYLQNGFIPEGAIFTEAGIPHIRMIHDQGNHCI
jgi:predicted GNAT family N-acyltransferase